MWFFLVSMACSTPEPDEIVGVEPELSLEVEAVSPAVPPPAAGGSIGGAPILPSVVVLGGISKSAVEAGVGQKMGAINRCYEDALANSQGLSGKVLVRFTIAENGSVSRAEIKSTSLRHEGVEACVSSSLAEARFPSLESGKMAIVTYPFVFGLL